MRFSSVPLDSEPSRGASKSKMRVLKAFLRVLRLGRKDTPPAVPLKIRVVRSSALPLCVPQRKEGEHEMVSLDRVSGPGYLADQAARRARKERERLDRKVSRLRMRKDEQILAELERERQRLWDVIDAHYMGHEGVMSAYTRAIRRTDLLLPSREDELQKHITGLERRAEHLTTLIKDRIRIRDAEAARSQFRFHMYRSCSQLITIRVRRSQWNMRYPYEGDPNMHSMYSETEA